jgi:starvation-inducible DNA-binding protein
MKKKTRGREEVPVQISRLLRPHDMILLEVRTMAKQADNDSDEGTNDLAVSDVIRTNELQVWFVSEHLVDSPLLRADGAAE